MESKKFFAEVILKGKDEASNILNAFFEEFNPQSSILIKGGNLKIESIFEEPPKLTVKAISECEEYVFSYGNFSEVTEEKSEYPTQTVEKKVVDTNENFEMGKSPREKVVSTIAFSEPEKDVSETEVFEETEDSIFEEEDSKVTEPGIMANEKSESDGSSIEKKDSAEINSQNAEVKPKRKYSKSSSNIHCEELEEIAKKSTSYDDFLNQVADWINFKKRKELFLHVIDAASQIEKITWKNLEEFLAPKNIAITPSVQTVLGKSISEAFKNSKNTLRPMELFGAIVSYKTYSFEKNVEKSITAEECLKSVFEDVSKEYSVKERIWDVLVGIGLFKVPEKERNAIVAVSNSAVGKNIIDVQEICSIVCNEEYEFINDVRLNFSKIINNFLKESECLENITVEEFLSMLQKGVLTEDELEKVYNS